MSTTPEQPQTPAGSDHDFDELTGVYGFFRRHQKLLLYTAGLFTLLTFSITGPLNNFVAGLFNKPAQITSIRVGGERVFLTTEDYEIGGRLSRTYQYGLPFGTILPVRAGEGGDTELSEVFAIMRRAAIAEGIEPSMQEVDRAIEVSREQSNAESAAKLAQARGFASLADFRQTVAEALRIGMHQRVQLLALDTSDAEVMRQVLLHKEKVGFKVATWDEAARLEEMKASSELSMDELKDWLDKQNPAQKMRMGVFDLPRVQLRFAAALLAEGQFDASQWTDSTLKDFTVGEDRLRALYDADKERWKVADTEDEYREFDDETVQAELTRQVQAERVMSDLNTKLKQKQLDVVKPMTDEIAKVRTDLTNAKQTLAEAAQEKLQKEKQLEAKKAELEKDPENAELKAEVETLEAEAQAARDAEFNAKPVLTQAEANLEAAQEAEKQARLDFDFVAEFNALVEGKTGFVVKQVEELLTAPDYEDLDERGLDLGTWKNSSLAPTTRNPGTIGNGPATTDKAVFIYQSLANDNEPLKPDEELEPLLKDAYWTEKAAAEGREKRKEMEEALLRLAKEKIPEFVTEREGDKQNRIDAQVKEWEDGVNAEITKATEMVEKPGLGSKAKQAWQTKLDNKQRELSQKEGRVKVIERQVENEIKNEIAEEARKHYGEVLDVAAAEVGFTVTTIDPLPRGLAARPRFDKVWGDTVAYVFQQHNELEEGEAVGPVVDIENKACHVIVATKVEPMTAADVTRREFEMMRKGFARAQVFNGLAQAFTREALEARYELEREKGAQEEAQ